MVNLCRVVYVIDEPDGPIARFGFAYGTLPGHAVAGEELFLATWDRATDEVRFSPGSGPFALIRDAIRGAERSVDVLMHHLLFDNAITLLAQTAERGVRVRVVINATDLGTLSGPRWRRFFEAGGEVRYKRTNPAQFQLMHHKLVIVDDAVLVNGSGNWSGSAFFNNFEFYLRWDRPDVVAPFVALFDRLWRWSLTPASLKDNISPARQEASELHHYFGNLHAHYHLKDDDGRWLDDGEPVEQVAAEPARLDLGAKISVGRSDHAHVDRAGLGAAHAAHLALLEHSEQG
jgi:phosphatidylserine/phosphatidylglycerophosphate/cardiolipin synthase-like enzyme